MALLTVLLGLAGTARPASADLVGSVAGTVRAAGVPVANAWVSVMPVTPTGGWAGRPAQTTTDQNGRYEVSDLDALHVKVRVRAPSFSGLADTYWPAAYSFATAGTLRVPTSGSAADVDLPASSGISGRVVDADTGDPIVGAQVVANVDAPPGWEPVGSAALSPGPGQFAIDRLPPVAVALAVRPPEGSNHLAQWFDGAGFHGSAVPVRPGTTGIVIRLQEGSQVSGVVRDDRGAAVPGAAVTVIGCPALCPMGAITDASGRYRINGVPPGPGIRAYADAAGSGLLSAWFAAPGQVGDTSVDLARGQVRGDLDVTLTAGAVAVGRIRDAQTGDSIDGVSIDLVDADNPLHSYVSRRLESPRDAPAGSEVVIGPVPPGRYSLIVYPGAENSDYLPVELVAGSGLDGSGLIDLSRGERAVFTVGLVRQQVSVGTGPGQFDAIRVGAGHEVPAGRATDPVRSAGWPGIFGGFLKADGSGFLQLGP